MLFYIDALGGIEVADAPHEKLAAYVSRVRAEKGLSLHDVRRRGDIPTSTVHKIERPRTATLPKYDTLVRLARGLGVSPDELFDIVGYKAIGTDATGGKKPANHGGVMISGVFSGGKDAQNHGSEPILGESSYAAEGIQRPDEQLRMLGDADWLFLPVLGAAACGEPIYAIMEHATETTKVPRTDAEALGANAAFVIRGDSMSGMMLNDGDSVLVRMLDGERPASGKVVIVRTPDGLVAKQYKCDEVGEYLQEHELGQEPRRVRFDEGSLVAVVVYHGRRM